MDSASLKRSSVGYLEDMDILIHDNINMFRNTASYPSRSWLVSKNGYHPYDSVRFKEHDWLVFGNETEGLPAGWLEENLEQTLMIPMLNTETRCLNLSTAVSVVMFEAIRQFRAMPDVRYR